MINIWDANARALVIFFLAMIAFILAFKLFDTKIDKKRKK